MKYIKKMYVAAIAIALACGMFSMVVAEMSQFKEAIFTQLGKDLQDEDGGAGLPIDELSNELINAYYMLLDNKDKSTANEACRDGNSKRMELKTRTSLKDFFIRGNFKPYGSPQYYHYGVCRIINEQKKRNITLKNIPTGSAATGMGSSEYDFSKPDFADFVRSIPDKNLFDDVLQQFTNYLKVNMVECRLDCTSDMNYQLREPYESIRIAFVNKEMWRSSNQLEEFFITKCSQLFTEAYNNYRQSQAPAGKTTTIKLSSAAWGTNPWSPDVVAQIIEKIKNITTKDEWLNAFDEFIESLKSYPREKRTEVFSPFGYAKDSTLPRAIEKNLIDRHLELKKLGILTDRDLSDKQAKEGDMITKLLKEPK